MSEFQNISEEEDYYEQLFKMAEKDQTGDLYKKELYIMKEDLEKIKSKTKLKIMHDNILQKIISEDYGEFLFNSEDEKEREKEREKEKELLSQNLRESNITINDNSNNNNKNSNQKEDNGDKETIEEVEYLKELYRLNYLAFSPMAIEYFDNIYNLNKSSSKKNTKINNENNFQNIDENNNNNSNNNNIIFNEEDKKISKENDEKLKKLLNFDYNCFELNNDLLFNICQGYIDTDKLKESNIKIPPQEQAPKEVLNNSSDSSYNDEYDIYEYDEELEQDIVNKVNKYVKNYENNIIFKGGIIRFKGELNNLPPKCKNKVKNLFYRKWEKEFTKLEQNNEKFLKKQKDNEKKKELKKQQKYLNKLKDERIKKAEESANDLELLDESKNIQKDIIVPTETKVKNIKKKKKKRFNKTISKDKDKKFYCSGFNMYKKILSGKNRNTSSKK